MTRRRRYSDYHPSKTGSERWLVSYADFMTLLFAFFVVMYSVSQVSERKYQVLSETLSSVFKGKVPVDAHVKDLMDHYPKDSHGDISGLSPEVNLVDTQTLASELQEALIHLVDPRDAKISATESWVEIEVNANLIFESASANPSAEALVIFSNLAKVLSPYQNQVEVAGYTDNVPIRNRLYQSNWELSSARASSVVRLLSEEGVSSGRLSAVGHGENHPVADNETQEGRSKNRRVVLLIAKHGVTEPQKDMSTLATEFPLTPLSVSVDQSEEPLPLTQESTPAVSDQPIVEPVRLKGGGLLFTSDPERSR